MKQPNSEHSSRISPRHRFSVHNITLRAAFAFINQHHSYQKAPQGGIVALAAAYDGTIRAVATLGRPRVPQLDDGFTVEITRLASDGTTKDIVSYLLRKCFRLSLALGYLRIISYCDDSRINASFKAASYRKSTVAQSKGWHGRARSKEQPLTVARYEIDHRPEAHTRRQPPSIAIQSPIINAPLPLFTHDQPPSSSIHHESTRQS